ncbi:MAG: transposase [Friedmanniella sp.]|nr:transposase [Friedmanniella sp.]
MIGADSYKRTHTLVAVDDIGRRLAEKTVRTNAEGHLDLLGWSRRLSGAEAGKVVFALEDCRTWPPAWRPTCSRAGPGWCASRPG